MSKIYSTPQELIQTDIHILVQGVLDDSYSKVTIKELEIKEDLINDSTEIECDLFLGSNKYTIKGSGRGLVDALFGSVQQSLQREYISLENIALKDFVITVDMNKFYRKNSKTDAIVEAAIFVSNECDQVFLFRHTCRSMISASVSCLTKMIEYYAHRMRKFHPYYFDTVTFDQYVSKCEHYSRTWPAMFRNSVDITDIHTDVDFLNRLPGCTVTDTAHRLFNQWLDLNPPGEFNDS